MYLKKKNLDFFKGHQAHPSLTQDLRPNPTAYKNEERTNSSQNLAPFIVFPWSTAPCATKEHFSDTEGRSCKQPVAVTPTLGEKVHV